MTLQDQINAWIDRLAAAIREPEQEDSQTLLRHLKGIRAHVIGFFDALERRFTPPDTRGK